MLRRKKYHNTGGDLSSSERLFCRKACPGWAWRMIGESWRMISESWMILVVKCLSEICIEVTELLKSVVKIVDVLVWRMDLAEIVVVVIVVIVDVVAELVPTRWRGAGVVDVGT